MDSDFFGTIKTFGIVGLGLMGGSLAKAIRNIAIDNNANISIYACDKNETSLEEAKNNGTIDQGFLPENVNLMLSKCDFVYICLYPNATIQFLQTHSTSFKSNSIITDIAGVKSSFSKYFSTCNIGKGFFIPGHPMAGGEKEGFNNSNNNFFKGRNYILLPMANTPEDKIDFLEKLISAMGFIRIIKTSPENHDHKIAFTSQLCHVIASSLVDSAEDTSITEFGGGSFEDLTRIAMINAPLWTELFLANKKELVNHIDNFEKSLNTLKSLIASEKSEELKKYLQDVREKRIEMSKS